MGKSVSWRRQVLIQNVVTTMNWLVESFLPCRTCRKKCYNPVDQGSIRETGNCCLCEHVLDDVREG